MNSRSKILLEEYKAIEQMHVHYDNLNMNMTAIVTAGIFAVWGIVIQTAFQSNAPADNPFFANSVSVLALALFFVLSIWIRYLTINRCIVILKLNRSHDIEKELDMKQNSIFRYEPPKLSEPLDSSEYLRRSPGGHTLELLLYFALSTFGGIVALIFQWHVMLAWTTHSYLLIWALLIAHLLAILWMTFCKLDALEHIENAMAGFPWNILFRIAFPINRFIRCILDLGKRPIKDFGQRKKGKSGE